MMLEHDLNSRVIMQSHALGPMPSGAAAAAFDLHAGTITIRKSQQVHGIVCLKSAALGRSDWAQNSKTKPNASSSTLHWSQCSAQKPSWLDFTHDWEVRRADKRDSQLSEQRGGVCDQDGLDQPQGTFWTARGSLWSGLAGSASGYFPPDTCHTGSSATTGSSQASASRSVGQMTLIITVCKY